MKNVIKLAVTTAILAAGALPLVAQTTNTVVLGNVNIALTGVEQVGTNSQAYKVGNKEVLKALNGLQIVMPDNSVKTNAFVGSNGKVLNGAKLVLAETTGSPILLVRQVINHTNVDTDVSSPGYLTIDSQTIVSTAKTQYALGNLRLSTPSLNLFAYGYTVGNIGKVTSRKNGNVNSALTSVTTTSASGAGTDGTNGVVLNGRYSATGPSVEGLITPSNGHAPGGTP